MESVRVTSAEQWAEQFRRGPPDAGLVPYEDILVPRLFLPWAERLLDLMDLVAGLAVLDVACGPGTVTRLAAARVGPYGQVTGCDISRQMLALAAAKPPVEGGAAIEYVECPADALAVADGTYDAITCQHGIEFFPDRRHALVEMRRAGRPGARVAVAAWATIAESPVFDGLSRAVGRVLGAGAAAMYRGGPWSLPDPSALHTLGVEAGLVDVEVRHEVLPLEFEGGVGQLLHTISATRVGDRLAALDEAGRSRLLEAAAEELEPVTVAGALCSETAAHILLATV
jgi:SAM-dependent methyltransferase